MATSIWLYRTSSSRSVSRAKNLPNNNAECIRFTTLQHSNSFYVAKYSRFADLEHEVLYFYCPRLLFYDGKRQVDRGYIDNTSHSSSLFERILQFVRWSDKIMHVRRDAILYISIRSTAF